MLTHVRKRTALLAALAAASLAVAASAGASDPPDLLKVGPNENQTAPLEPGVTFQASLFPISLRIAANAVWWGDQYRTTSRGKPAFGWAQFAHPGVKGAISLVTAFGPTPSVAATIARLQAGGSHAGGRTGAASSSANRRR
jgi:hypothetical protein